MESLVVTPEKMTPEKMLEYRSNYAPFASLAEHCSRDEALRARCAAGDVEDLLPDLGFVPPPGIEVRIVANSAEVYNVVMPPDPNVALSDETLGMVAGGGKCASTAGTVGSASTVACSCFPSTVITAGTLGSAGTASP